MPMFNSSYPQPQMTNYAPQSYGMGMQGQMAPQMPMQSPMAPPMAPQGPMPQQAPQLPQIPKPGQLPVRGGMSTNSTGGPSQGANGDLRAGVFTQLYRLGKQMDGRANLFGQYDPTMPAPPVDPLAAMQPPPVEDPRLMPQLPPAPQAPSPDMYPPHLRPQVQAPPRPIDRFPGLAAQMGRPARPAPNGRRPY
jgi:hypothetical protein